MQPGRARTSGLGVPLLPLARLVGWLAPVRPTHGVLVLSCPSAALHVCSVLGRWAPVHRCARAVCCGASAVSSGRWLLFTGVLARCVVLHVRCRGPLGSCSPVCVLCTVRVCPGWLCPSSSPPNFRFFFSVFFFCFFFFFFSKKKEEKEITKKRKAGARVHCRHRHGELARRCYSVVSSGVCRRCCGGGRAPGVRLACPDVHGYGSGWVWLGVSLLLVLAG